MKKTCTKCNIQKNIDSFHFKPNSSDGRDSRCKSCVSKYKKRHNQKKRARQNNQFFIQDNLSVGEDILADCYEMIIGQLGGCS